MALYLGNQKVSLRSGQDPTFDYGFDSNGSLVFANKNATEINNFLNYDSSYSEILDLSNLSKMEKVAVNGTADRKMEGLKGLLVSPNAPFTGSSPQINVSYTGLNKSALVSLFESAPYNVGYEKVGNPTIVDGVVSEFSENDYLILSTYNPLKDAKNWEFKSKIKTPENYSVRTSYPVLGVVHSGIVSINISNSGKLRLYIGNLDNWTVAVIGTTTLTKDTVYWIKAKFTGEKYELEISQDGKNYTVEASVVSSNKPISSDFPLTLGVGFISRFSYTGSIDLNETYIKVNGVPWFTGKPAMTKTCSIVGATGTADLTQEDKNIILNKGWSLTVQ